MYNPPNFAGDPAGDWFEVYNRSDNDIRLCGGWTLQDDNPTPPDTADTGAPPSTLVTNPIPDSGLLVPAHRHFVFGRNGDQEHNGGVKLDAELPFLSLAPDDVLTISFVKANGAPLILDTVDYSANCDGNWDGGTSGQSIELDPDLYGPLFNDDPVSYTHLRAHETPEHLVCRL